ncbi:MAG: UDP-N-acetylmuramoyl-L-alanyl-D-glutamate--2,6-diaminopimelate ligase [Thermomicrobium sp.]|nr:UDP-N-acetylmuramoyl-L-alanyl-D-glutamate--2,6-diaminopimelate ligase [Thermomicrobium sp.]MCS7246358.1 UDP-N-acetylmuramoyl-L-alanyl-D-glutamate--2,6-diaminopimelate ligase [Thermomicrobium sp.]MDW7982391.1 UDP-N-acetylmuramoyl-L-alanyl-D-glutamate--2,6-diaminopimelate ligase [Thermomicrobium sp.]
MPPLGTLLTGLPVRVQGDPAIDIRTVVYDSRRAVPGSLFVALRGQHTDGHRHLHDARARGAIAALVEEWPQGIDFPAIAQVPDTRVALAAVAARFYEYPAMSLGLIGVTGTDGKTTTTFLIDALLRAAGYRTGLVGTIAIRIGEQFTQHDLRQTTPESLDIQHLLAQMRENDVQWGILEATSHGLVLHRLDHCPFDIAVVTNVTQEHLDFHGTIENYWSAKGKLLEFVRDRVERPYPRGIVLNADDEGARWLARFAGDVPILWYSARGHASLSAEGLQLSTRGTVFRLRFADRVAQVNLQLIGPWNVDNALAAAGVGLLLGVPMDVIADGLGQLPSIPGRFSAVDCGQPFTVVIDYAHTPESFQRVLPLARELAHGRVIVVFGSAGQRDRIKRRLQGAIAARWADFAVLTSEDPRFEDPWLIIDEIAEGMRSAGALEGERYVRVEDRGAAIREAFRRARPGDIVLLLGKGHERCIIYGDERRPWDELSEAKRALHELGYQCSS